MRVLMVDPFLFTLPYDAAFCRALARAGAAVRLVARPLRPGETLAPTDFSFRPLFYGVSEKLRQPRPALKGLEHAKGLAALARLIHRKRPDIVHLQWLAVPLLGRPFPAATGGVTNLVLTARNRRCAKPPPRAGPRWCSASVRGDPRPRRENPCLARGPRYRSPAYLVAAPLAARARPDGSTEPVPSAEPGVATVLLWDAIEPYEGLDVLVRAVFHHLPADLPLRAVVAGRPLMDLAPLHRRSRPHRPTTASCSTSASSPRLGWPPGSGPRTSSAFPYRTIDGSSAARHDGAVRQADRRERDRDLRRGAGARAPGARPAGRSGAARGPPPSIDSRPGAASRGRRQHLRLAELLPSWERFAVACLERYEQQCAERDPPAARSPGRTTESLRPIDPASSRHQTRQPPRS